MAHRFPIGTTYTTRGKHPLTCTVVDQLTTRNAAGKPFAMRTCATRPLREGCSNDAPPHLFLPVHRAAPSGAVRSTQSQLPLPGLKDTAMLILVSITYEVVTEESAEDGECAETGFDTQDEPMSFRELVELLRGHQEPSSWPMREAGERDWFTSESEQDYRTGEHRRTSVHFSRKNNPRALKYWRAAARAAGLVCARA